MKLLQVCQRYSPYVGGVEEHVRNISERLAKNNDVLVATTDPSGKLPKHDITNGVRIIRFKSWAPNEAYFYSNGLKNFLKDHSHEYEVVHSHSYHAFPALFAARAKDRNKLVFTSHYHGSGHTFFRALLNKPYKYVGKINFESADKIICVSEYERNLVIKNFNINTDKIIKIPNGIDPTEYLGLKKKQHDYNLILCVGRLERYKGIQYLIEALPKLGSDFKLEVVGKGPYAKSLNLLVNKLHLEDSVSFFQDLSRKELLQKYFDADLFALLSNHEAFGISVAEALSSKTPCIVANASALSEWIDNKNCFGIDLPINQGALINVVKKTIGKKITSTEMLNDWNDVVDKIAKVYAE